MTFGILGEFIQLVDHSSDDYCFELEDKYVQDVPGTALLSDLGIVHGQQVRQF